MGVALDEKAGTWNGFGHVTQFLSSFLATLTLCLSGYVEVFRHSSLNNPQWMLIGAAVTLTIGGILTLLTGVLLKSHKGFRIWQPFRGGFVFIVFQGIGWIFFAISLMLFLSLHRSFEHLEKTGSIASVGFLGFCGILILQVSINFFESGKHPWKVKLITRENMVALCCATAAIILGAILEFSSSTLSPETWTVAAQFGLVGNWLGAIVVIVEGRKRVKNLWPLRPFEGGLYFFLMQTSGWSGVVLANYMYWCISSHFDSPSELFSGALFSVFLLFSGAVVLLIASLDLFEAQETRDVFRRLHTSAEVSGLLLINMLCFFTACCLDLSRSKSKLVVVAVGVMEMVPWLIHLFSCRTIQGFRLFRVTDGGDRFILLSTVGWSVYGVSSLITVLVVVNMSLLEVRILSASTAFLLFSSAILYIALQFFNNEEKPRGADFSASAMNAVMLSSILLATMSTILFLSADYTVLPAPCEKSHVSLLATACIIVACIMAHMSGVRRFRTFKFYQPFGGGDDFIVLQTLGWTIFGTLIPCFATLLINLLFEIPMNKGVLSTAGLFGMVPYSIIVISLHFFQEEQEADFDENSKFWVSVTVHGKAELGDVLRDCECLLPHASTREMRRALERIRDICSNPVHHSSTIHYTILCCVLSAISLIMTFLCEVFHFLLPSLQQRIAILFPLFVIGSVASVLCCVIVHTVIGPRKHHGYSVWMPFSGGFRFMLLQTVGWVFFVVHLEMSFYLLWSVIEGSWIYIGSFLVLGFVGFASFLLLLIALGHFTLVEQTRSTFMDRHSEWTVGSLLTLAAVCGFVLVEYSEQENGVSLITLPLLIAAAVSCAIAVPLGWKSLWKTRRFGSEELAAKYHFAMLSEVVVATLLVRYVLNSTTFTAYWWAFYVAIAASSHSLMLLVTIVMKEQRSFSFFFFEVFSEFFTFIVYTFHFLCILLFAILSFYIHVSPSSILCFFLVNGLSFGTDFVIVLTKLLCSIGCFHAAYFFDVEASCFFVPLLLYTLTYNSKTVKDGSRAWGLLRNRTFFWDSIARYFSYSIISELDVANVQQGNVIMGFHPHGVCPYTTIWGTLCNEWKRKALPNVTLHVSTFLLSVPIVRDLLLLLGVVEVSLEAIEESIKRKECVLLVPGGQAEMKEASDSRKMVLVARHRGLFRIAMKNGATLVPLICFGETEILDGVILPQFQWFWKSKLGMAYPQLPHGRFLLPLPRRRQLTLVVGKAIVTPKCFGEPNLSDLEALHNRYYEEIVELFYRHREAAGYPEMEIQIKD